MNEEQQKSPLGAGFKMTLTITVEDWSKMIEVSSLEELVDGKTQAKIHLKGFEGLQNSLDSFISALTSVGFGCTATISDTI